MSSFRVLTSMITPDDTGILPEFREERPHFSSSNIFPSGIFILPGINILYPLEREFLERESSKCMILLNSLSALARSQQGTLVSGPMICKGENGKFYKRSYLLDENGSIQGHYDQCHIPREESAFFEQGSKPFLFSCCATRIAILHAYELLYPEYARSMALSGVQMVIVCGVTGLPFFQGIKSILQTRSLENHIFLAAACSGEGEGNYNTGIFSPSGADISEKNSSWFYSALIDTGPLSSKAQTRFFSSRRPDLYHPVTEFLV
ncbi:MAG: carbon-nitrogen hydrolase family protein [Synergistales bacterium]|nr:carbon-nitrogen hydrolase family protein [Synergistales bacterium]